MDFTPITKDQINSFKKDGFLVVRNALNPEQNQAVRDACDRLAHNFLNKGEVLNKPWYNDLDMRPGLLYEKALLDLVTNSTTVPLVVQLLTPNIHLHSTALTYKNPENPEYPMYRRGWHRDIRIPRDLGHTHLPMVGIKICYCLSDFSEPDSGMTLMARKSHLDQEPLRIPKDGVDPIGQDVCELKLNEGDAVLFENRIFHTATPNRTSRVAKRIIYGYAFRWMKQEVYLDPPDEELLKISDPITKQLLGGYRDIDTRAWALEDWAIKHKVMPDRVPWHVEA
ncbi:MAG: phytanoyl-CoA dioxygenase family protein [Saprospiraceae bacterium]|nr:phytanoyl-CoA dioxygenase family protein [Saprospiraceae bacterium]